MFSRRSEECRCFMSRIRSKNCSIVCSLEFRCFRFRLVNVYVNSDVILTVARVFCFCQLAGIKRHKDLSFSLQPKPQGTVSTNSRVLSDSEDSSTQKKAPRSRKVSQLRSSPLSHTSFEGSETEHETTEDTTFNKRRVWLRIDAGPSSPGASSERFNRATSSLPVLVVDMSPRTPPRSNIHRIAKRRKGIPHRAPLRA